MLLLVVDTSGKSGSIALARGETDGSCGLLESVRLDGGAFSAQLVPQIGALLSGQKLSKSEIGGFVAVSGPGSFTGLRVGLAAVKALAEVLEKPIAAVSLLEAVAFAGGINGDIVAAMDAGRRQIYSGEYHVSSGSAVRIKECLLNRDEFSGLVRGAKVVTPDPAIAAFAQSLGADAHSISAPGIALVAELGWRKIAAGDTVTPDALEANYISRADAEMFNKSSS
ncbi:MAG: tRNA (adenosine(37)-N6)-threonylcarbamoyltransferase complex dimerization subunit type 1 TsaB [Terriglobales bacterium]